MSSADEIYPSLAVSILLNAVWGSKDFYSANTCRTTFNFYYYDYIITSVFFSPSAMAAISYAKRF